MEFSKKWLICSALVSLALIIACAAGADLTEITLAVLAETTASIVGDPACDLTIAWEIFDEKQRKIFFSAAEADKATVIRARVWAIYKAMKNYNAADIDQSILARDVLFRINEELGLGAEPDLY